MLSKLKKYVFVYSLLFLLAACTVRIRELTFTNGDVMVSKYEVSEISNVHDFVEVRKGRKTITVLEANSYGYADIFFNHDTIVIQYLPGRPYMLLDSAFGYKIKLDTTISIEYWQQKMEEREKESQKIF